LQLDHQIVLLTPDKRLFPHHTERDRWYDFTAATAVMVQSPDRSGPWELCNLSTGAWRVTLPDHSTRTIDPHRTIALVPGMRIDFGARCAEVIAG